MFFSFSFSFILYRQKSRWKGKIYVRWKGKIYVGKEKFTPVNFLTSKFSERVWRLECYLRFIVLQLNSQKNNKKKTTHS